MFRLLKLSGLAAHGHRIDSAAQPTSRFAATMAATASRLRYAPDDGVVRRPVLARTEFLSHRVIQAPSPMCSPLADADHVGDGFCCSNFAASLEFGILNIPAPPCPPPAGR